MTGPVVQWDWGDGQTEEGGLTATHEYEAGGSYRIRATGDGFSASASVPVAGPGDAHPVLTIPDVDATVDETETYETSLVDEAGTSQRCYGHVTITPTDGQIDVGALAVIQRDFNGPGEDLSMAFRDDGDGGAVGDYGLPNGFPVAEGLQGETTNELTYTGEPFTADCRTEIRLVSHAVLCHADWTLTVTAGGG